MQSIESYTNDIANKSYSFRKSYDNLSRKEQQKLRDSLQKALQYRTIRTFYQRCNGSTVISAVEKDIIERILKQHGLKWDYEHETDSKGIPSR